MLAPFLTALLMVSTAITADSATVHANNPPSWGSPTTVEELRFGSQEGPEEYALGLLSAFAVGPDGSIFIHDSTVNLIRQYDSDGRFVRSIGGWGGEPGQFREVQGMHVTEDGSLVVWSPNNRTLIRYDPSGQFESQFRVESGLHAPHVFVAGADGDYLIKKTVSGPSGEPEVFGGGWRTRFLRVSPSGAVVDSFEVPAEHSNLPRYVVMTSEGARQPFNTLVCHAMSNQGYLVVGDNRTYELELWFPDGSRRRIERAYEPVGITGEERAQWDAWSRYFSKSETVPELPFTKPAFRGISVDADGRIWLERYTVATKRKAKSREAGDKRPPFVWREAATFDVIQPDGTFLGTVKLPEDMYMFRSENGYIWGIHTGENDVKSVVRLRLEID